MYLIGNRLIIYGIDFIHINIFNINKDLFIFNIYQIFN